MSTLAQKLDARNFPQMYPWLEAFIHFAMGWSYADEQEIFWVKVEEDADILRWEGVDRRDGHSLNPMGPFEEPWHVVKEDVQEIFRCACLSPDDLEAVRETFKLRLNVEV